MNAKYRVGDVVKILDGSNIPNYAGKRDEIAQKIHELLSLCLEIQRGGHGEGGYPYVRAEISNYTEYLYISIKDNGYSPDAPYDGDYRFDFNCISDRTYKNCKQHLQDLKERVSACTTMNAPTAERI